MSIAEIVRRMLLANKQGVMKITVMQKLNNGNILFIFNKKLLQKDQAFGHMIKRLSSG